MLSLGVNYSTRTTPRRASPARVSCCSPRPKNGEWVGMRGMKTMAPIRLDTVRRFRTTVDTDLATPSWVQARLAERACSKGDLAHTVWRKLRNRVLGPKDEIEPAAIYGLVVFDRHDLVWTAVVEVSGKIICAYLQKSALQSANGFSSFAPAPVISGTPS